jgi:CDP-diacylglycerol--glycerol-3-phosphate 3-phosphatidyltransferase
MIFIQEGRLDIWQALVLISRDFAVIFFGIYLALRQTWSNFQFRSIWAGKITTSLQFFVLLGMTFRYEIPASIFGCFIVLGVSALFELYFIERRLIQKLR